MKYFKIEDIKNSKCMHLNQHLLTEPVKKKAKYGNVKVEIDGITFSSKKEASRYIELRMLVKAGDIIDLRLQVPFKLSVCVYLCDFAYYVKNGDEWIYTVEDVKSSFTRKLPVYKLKKKLMLSEQSIEIKET